MKLIKAGFVLLIVVLAMTGCAGTFGGTTQAVSAGSNAPSDDTGAVQGRWSPSKAELAGQPFPQSVLNMISLKLENGKYEVFVGEEPDRGTYSLDVAAKPKRMRVTGTNGPNNGKTFPAIYELTGDTLRICYDLSGADFPTEFRSTPGTKLYLVTYNRKKE